MPASATMPAMPHPLTTTPEQAQRRLQLAAAIARAGGPGALAVALGRDPGTIWRWSTMRSPIPRALAKRLGG